MELAPHADERRGRVFLLSMLSLSLFCVSTLSAVAPAPGLDKMPAEMILAAPYQPFRHDGTLNVTMENINMLAANAASFGVLPLQAMLIYKQGVPVPWDLSKTNISVCNLVFVKVAKCASSTTGGIIRRIGAHYGLSGVHGTEWIKKEPGIWANHGTLNSTGPPSMVLMARLNSPTLLMLLFALLSLAASLRTTISRPLAATQV